MTVQRRIVSSKLKFMFQASTELTSWFINSSNQTHWVWRKWHKWNLWVWFSIFAYCRFLHSPFPGIYLYEGNQAFLGREGTVSPHLFILSISVDPLLCTRYYSSYRRCLDEEDRVICGDKVWFTLKKNQSLCSGSQWGAFPTEPEFHSFIQLSIQQVFMRHAFHVRHRAGWQDTLIY